MDGSTSPAASRGSPGLAAPHRPAEALSGGASGQAWALARSRAVFLALLGLAVVARIGLLVNGAIDPDESEHLHAAWLVGTGQVPYRDFWDHHAPLFFYLMAPLTRWVSEGPGVYLGGRLVMLGAAAVSLALVYRLGRRLSAVAAGAAVMSLVFLPRFAEKTTEVRPDGPALAAVLAALLLVVRWREGRGARALWPAGLCLGLAVALNLKAAYGAVGLALAVVLGARDDSRSPAHWWGALGRLVGGSVVVPAAVAGWLAWTGGLGGVAAAARDLGTNLHFADHGREWPVADAAIGFAAVALAGLAVAIRREGPRILVHRFHGPVVWPTATTAFVLLLPTTPGVARHAWIPVLAPLGLYAGFAWSTLTARRGGRARAALVAVSVAAALGMPAFNALRNGLRPANDGQFAIMRAMLGAACPGEAVLDGTALYVFRPAAYRYRALINGVQGWLLDGTVTERELVDDVRAARPPVAYSDRRVRMVPALGALVSGRYVPDGSGIRLAGVHVDTRDAGESGTLEVDLLAGGRYQVVVTPGLGVVVDGRPVERPTLDLIAGSHQVSWSGPPGRIELAAVPCSERGSR